MMSLDALEGCAKNPVKIGFILSTLLLDAEETETIRKKRPQKKVTYIFGGALKTGRKQFHHFFQKIEFFKILKNPYLYSVSRKKWVATIFFKKAMLQGGQT